MELKPCLLSYEADKIEEIKCHVNQYYYYCNTYSDRILHV